MNIFPPTFRADVVATLQGVVKSLRFEHQGRNPQTGTDCAGLLLYALHVNEWEPLVPEITESRTYTLPVDPHHLLAVMEAECDPITLADVKPCDIVLFAKPGKLPVHLGVVTMILFERPVVLHVDEKKIVEHSLDDLYSKLVYGAYRIKGLE